MADMPNTARAAAWETAIQQLAVLDLRLEDAASHEEADAARRELGALQDKLLDTPAPHLTAVRQKLEMLWEARLSDLDRDSEERRLILEDLEDLIQTQHQLLGV